MIMKGPPHPPAPRKSTDRPDPSGQGEDFLALLQDTFSLSRSLVGLQVAKASLAMRRGAVWGLVAAVAGVALATLTIVSTWLLFNGVAGAARQVFAGTPWLGTLLAGVAGLLVAVALLRSAFGRAERAVVERLRKTAPSSSSEVAPR